VSQFGGVFIWNFKMNIDSLTFGELKQIAAMFGAKQSEAEPHPFIGKYVICRCYSAGVHAGVLVSQVGDQAVLKDSRRLWSWKAKAGVALSGLAVNGLESGKVDTLVDDIALTGVIETIPCSAEAMRSINGAQ
jgi:hypothetical protein